MKEIPVVLLLVVVSMAAGKQSLSETRDVRSQDMVSVSRPKFEISCLGLGLILIVSVSSLMVSCLEAFRDFPSICDDLK